MRKNIKYLIVGLLLLLLISKCSINEYFSTKQKINIIIPIRDREVHLEQIIKRFKEILPSQNLDYKIYIIEQTSGNLFNKGKLINIGVLESQKDNYSNYYVMSDVDIFPKTNDIISYKPYDGIKHLYGYDFCLGGIFIFNLTTFKKINGFSNEFWGWGREDDDFQNRCKYFGININRDNFIYRNSTKLIEDKPSWGDNKKGGSSSQNSINDNTIKLNNNIIRYKNKDYSDGLSSCKYKIIKKYNYQNDPKLIRIVVDV